MPESDIRKYDIQYNVTYNIICIYLYMYIYICIYIYCKQFHELSQLPLTLGSHKSSNHDANDHPTGLAQMEVQKTSPEAMDTKYDLRAFLSRK